jgi:hypothetical protein
MRFTWVFFLMDLSYGIIGSHKMEIPVTLSLIIELSNDRQGRDVNRVTIDSKITD